jgi:hypothetical protein
MLMKTALQMESIMKNNFFSGGFFTKLLVVGFALITFLNQSQAQVTFNFNYTDVGTGFNDATDGATRRGALESSASILASYFGNYSATIDIDVNGGVTDDSFLASAGSNYTAFTGAGFGDRGDVMRQILGGDVADPSAGVRDGTVNWNFQDFNWEYGSDFQAGEFDFVSTAVHELMHTLGFISGIRQDGTDYWGNAVNEAGIWEPFDEFVADTAGALINGATFVNDGTRWNAASIGGTGTDGLFFDGANAVAANGGNAVNLYSPTTWQDGSSGSHLDDAAYTGTFVMESAATSGLGFRSLNGVEIGVLMDIGYVNIIAVPEPTGAVVLTALGLVGLLRRRRLV